MAKTPIILGIDEVGRGPWAGPLVIGAVVLGPKFAEIASSSADDHTTNDTVKDNDSDDNANNISNNNLAAEHRLLWQSLTDSKKLSVKKREELNLLIQKHAAAHATGWVSAAEIDRYGLSASLKLATRRAVKQILAQKIYFDEIIIDGTINFLANTPLADRVTVLKKADFLIKEVSAAAIIAKVARDNYMVELGAKYPAYGFEKHVGYGTAAHKAALIEHGPCPEHRQSFKPIAELIQNRTPSVANHTPAQNANLTEVNFTAKNRAPRPQNHTPSATQRINTTAKGKTAETAASDYLQTQGHTVIAQNYKTKFYEIDLISILDDKIYFTEVKYSQNPRTEGTPLARITAKKHEQMTFAAKNFCKTHPECQNLQPLLAAAEVIGADYQVKNWFTL